MSNVVSIHGYALHVIEDQPMIEDIELAERLGYKRPRKIRDLIKRLIDLGLLPSKQVRPTVGQTPGGGRPSTCYYLSEKAALKVITRSDTAQADQITDEMIDVFIDYRSKQQSNSQMSRLELINMARDAELEKLQLEQKVANDAPKVEFHDAVTATGDTYGVTEAAKLLGIPPFKLYQYLRCESWMTRKNVPYQRVINAGLMATKLGTYRHPKHGLSTSITPRITAKGLAKLKGHLINDQ